MLTEIKFDDNATVKEQISDFLRQKIASGALPQGTPLASNRKLAKLWGIPISTVQSGLKPLVSEGLLVRMVGRGTRVRDRKRALTTVGVYDWYDMEHDKTSVFQHNLHGVLHRLLSGDGIQMRSFVDYRASTSGQPKPLPELQRACECGDIQGVIMPTLGWHDLQWVKNLGVPLAVFGASTLPNFVWPDFDQFCDLAVGCLRDQGCRSVGLISAMPKEDVDSTVSCFGQCYRSFLNTAARLGMEVREEWISTSNKMTIPASSPQYGYDRFMDLWALPEHPDGLVVDNDVMARGVITAVLKERVRVPKQLRLVLHKNHEIEQLCPFPAAMVEVYATEIAGALISHLKRQFYEGRIGNVLVPFHLTYLNLVQSAKATRELVEAV